MKVENGKRILGTKNVDSLTPHSYTKILFPRAVSCRSDIEWRSICGGHSPNNTIRDSDRWIGEHSCPSTVRKLTLHECDT